MNNKIYAVLGGSAGVLASAVPALATYEVNPTNAAMINDMGTGVTTSYLNLFTSNWPVIAQFAVTLTAFFFVWRLIMRFVHGSH